MTEEAKKKPYSPPQCEEWKGSPLPWRTYRYDAAFCDVEHAEGKSILVGSMFFKDDAALIVQAVNAHERLVAENARLLADNLWKREVLSRVLQWLDKLLLTDELDGMDELVDNVRNAIGEEAGND